MPLYAAYALYAPIADKPRCFAADADRRRQTEEMNIERDRRMSMSLRATFAYDAPCHTDYAADAAIRLIFTPPRATPPPPMVTPPASLRRDTTLMMMRHIITARQPMPLIRCYYASLFFAFAPLLR